MEWLFFAIQQLYFILFDKKIIAGRPSYESENNFLSFQLDENTVGTFSSIKPKNEIP